MSGDDMTSIMLRLEESGLELKQAQIVVDLASNPPSKASEVGKDKLLLLPQAFDGKPASTLAQFKKAVDQADAKHIPILTFHGVPDLEHPWVTTSPEKFKTYMKYLKDNDFKVISLRDYPLKN